MANISQVQLPSGVSYPIKAPAIPYGAVDSTSTATVFTATVPGITELTDGTIMMLHNGVITSASGFTVNINNLGAKKCYNNMTNATRDTTIFNIAYTMVFVYSEALDEGNGGWWIYRGYDGNTNTIGYQLRTNSGNKVAADTGYRYRLWFTSADTTKWVPANTSTATNATTNRTLNTKPIDPFGAIVYRATNDSCTAGGALGATGIWQQYTLTIGYSYMQTGFSLTFPAPVYVKCTPQTDGSAVMDSIVQALPSSKDGKIYIYLGTAYSATSMELEVVHPVYHHDGSGVKVWTGKEIPTVPTNVSAFTNDAGYLTSYTETDPTVPSWAKASSKPTYTASEVGALPSTTTYVSTVNGSSGAVTISVPTKTSDLTNDSNFATGTGFVSGPVEPGVTPQFSDINLAANTVYTLYAKVGSSNVAVQEIKTPADTNTTYALSNALSSHKFTETLTAGGSGSGTSTATMEFVAGTGITLTDDTTNKKITIASSVVNTDEKVSQALSTSNDTYSVLFRNATGTSNSTDTSKFSSKFTVQASTGNVTAGTINGYTLAAASEKAVDTSISAGSSSANLPTSAAVASFVEGKGYITLNDVPTIPSITLNGNTTTLPSFYAPTSAGTSGYYLKSTGSGAPEWAAVSAGGVTDVTVGGTSVVISGVATIASPVQIVRW